MSYVTDGFTKISWNSSNPNVNSNTKCHQLVVWRQFKAGLSFRSTMKRTIVSFLCFTWKFRNVTHCTQFELCTFVVQRFSFILKAIISKNRRTRTTQRGHEVRCPLLTSHCSYLRRQRLRGRRWRLEKKKVTSLFLRLFLNQAVFFRQMIFLGFRRQKSLDDVSDEVWFENYGFEVIRTFVEPKALLCYSVQEIPFPQILWVHFQTLCVSVLF